MGQMGDADGKDETHETDETDETDETLGYPLGSLPGPLACRAPYLASYLAT